MTYTITFTPESICEFFNVRYNQEFTVEQIENNWEQITDYIENWKTNGLMSESLWDDFQYVADEWEIDLFEENLVESED